MLFDMPTRRDPHGNVLPPRCHWKGGGYYYVVGNRWRKLGRDYAEALREWARREGTGGRARTFAQAAEAFMLERGPELKASTRLSYESSLKRLLASFGACHLADITSPMVKQYAKARSKPVAANHEKAVMSSIFSFAMSEGWCTVNPCSSVRRRTERPRRRTAAAGEAEALAVHARPLWRALLTVALLTGMRPGELRELRRDQLTAAGIDLVRPKTGAGSLIEWTPALREAVNRALDAHGQVLRPGIQSLYVFPTRRGGCYTAPAFSRAWARLRDAAGVEGLQLRDTRRTAATAASDLEHARALLGHGSTAITKRVYRVRDRVRPVG